MDTLIQIANVILIVLGLTIGMFGMALLVKKIMGKNPRTGKDIYEDANITVTTVSEREVIQQNPDHRGADRHDLITVQPRPVGSIVGARYRLH